MGVLWAMEEEQAREQHNSSRNNQCEGPEGRVPSAFQDPQGGQRG
jgi:hypothetical protein